MRHNNKFSVNKQMSIYEMCVQCTQQCTNTAFFCSTRSAPKFGTRFCLKLKVSSGVLNQGTHPSDNWGFLSVLPHKGGLFFAPASQGQVQGPTLPQKYDDLLPIIFKKNTHTLLRCAAVCGRVGISNFSSQVGPDMVIVKLQSCYKNSQNIGLLHGEAVR